MLMTFGEREEINCWSSTGGKNWLAIHYDWLMVWIS